jgi:ABC-type bacteriocin/lantibiotic exporter with double-glycine peptidase domain
MFAISQVGLAPAPWRDGQRDAINCVAFLAGYFEEPTSYSELNRTFSSNTNQVSLATLQDWLGQVNVVSDAMRVPYTELSQIAAPYVAYIEPEGSQRGSFVIVLGADTNSIQYVDGGSLTIIGVTADEWRRHWHGHVLVPRRRTTARTYCFIALSSCAVGLLLGSPPVRRIWKHGLRSRMWKIVET